MRGSQTLVADDDGVGSPDLWAAVSRLAHLGKLWVVAAKGQLTSAAGRTPPGFDGCTSIMEFTAQKDDNRSVISKSS